MSRRFGVPARVLALVLVLAPVAGCGFFRGTQTDARNVMHPDADIRRETVQAIGEAPPSPDAMTVLVDRLLKDPDPLVRAQAARSLGRHRYPEGVAYLLEALKDTHAVVRWDACDALGHVGDPVAVEPIMALLVTDDNVDVKRAAAGSLTLFKDERSIPALIAALGDLEPGVAKSAANALVLITGQGFGLDREAWQAWWNSRPGAPAHEPAARQE